MLKFLKYKGSKKVKEISLTAQGENEQDCYTVKIPQTLLVEHSVFFRDMTKTELKKNKKTKLESTTPTALKKIVEYMQQGELSFQNHVEALETLEAADKYKFKHLKKMCVDYLITVIETSNVCSIFETAISLSLCNLIYFCLRYIDEHIKDVFTTRGFLSLQKSTVREILSRNSLNVRSEKSVFDAVLGWGLNYILRKGLNPNNQEDVMKTTVSLLHSVRFSVMSDEEIDDQEVSKYYSLMNTREPYSRQRTISGMSHTSSGTVESIGFQPRHYVSNYVASLNVYESMQHTIKTGEVFCLRIEILKGTVFLTGITLAMRAFAPTKDTACLYVALTATNVLTSDQVTKRGAFLNTSEEASLVFPSALVAKESESIEIALSAKRAENISPLTVSNDIQIVMPESQKVAMKITPSTVSTDELDAGRCIFKEIEYFF